MQKRISQRQEKSVAADLGGRVQAASGAAKHGGGDVRAPGYRIECKYTEKPVYTLKLEELEKLKKQAYGSLEQPVMQLAFVDRLGRRTEFSITNHVQDASAFSFKVMAKSFKVYRGELEHRLTQGLPFVVMFLNNGFSQGSWVFQHWADFVKEVNRC